VSMPLLRLSILRLPGSQAREVAWLVGSYPIPAVVLGLRSYHKELCFPTSPVASAQES